MALILQSKGVENCYFMLRIDNKDLIGVNPYSKKLTKEQKAAIFAECINNRWYFFREVARVSESGAATGVGGGSEFILNRGNLAYLWCAEKNIDVFLIMPRQTGKTWAAIIDAVWTFQFTRGSTILHFNKSQKDSNDNLQRIKSAISMLPLYLQHSADENLDPSEKRLVKNAEKSMRNIIGSQIEAMASAGNESKADAMARGKTAPKIWYDEIAFIFFNEVIYGAATPAHEKARESAIEHDAPYGISVTTTPGDLATPHGAFAYKMMKSAVPFNEKVYDYSAKKLYDIINNTPDKMPMFFIQFSYLQLGETDEWYLKRFKKMNDPLRARREYLLEWFDSNGNSPFDPDDVALIGDLARENAANVKVKKINKYFNLNIYSEYTGKKPVLIGVDVAGSLYRDSSALVVVNPETLVPMAVFNSNMIESNKLKKLIITIVRKVYPNCIITIENNSIGTPLINELRETPVGRCIYKERRKKERDMGANAMTKKRKIDVMQYGHNTNTTTRPQMMDMLETIVHSSPAHLALPELYEEVKLLELRNGRIDHSQNSHDDTVMAYLGVLWMVRYGTGLKGKGIYYNINSDDDGLEDMAYDVAESHRFANRLFKKIHEAWEDDGSDDMVQYMRKDHHIETSSTWAEKEREEMFRAMEARDGLDDDDDDPFAAISDNTKHLLLRNWNALLYGDGNGDDDPVSKLIRPERVSTGVPGFGDDDDWSNRYSY